MVLWMGESIMSWEREGGEGTDNVTLTVMIQWEGLAGDWQTQTLAGILILNQK